MPSVLAILATGFEETEAIAPVDLLRRAGADVILASLGPDLLVKSRSGIIVRADTPLENCLTASFDCIFLPGGPGVRHLRADPRIRELLLRHAAAKSWIAAICAAPTVLHDAGLLRGKRYTAHPSVAQELPAILSNERVVIDGHLITSRGAATSIDFGLEIVKRLFSPEKSNEIASSIAF